MRHRHVAVRAMAAASAATAAAAITIPGPAATAAYAVSRDVAYDCVIFSSHFDYDATVRMTAPASAEVGDTVQVTADLSDLPGVSPVAVDKWSTTGTAITAGAQQGLIDLEGAERSGPVAARQPMAIGPLTGTLPLTAAGEVDVTMGDITVTATAFGSQVAIECSPKGAPPPLTTIRVSGGGGGEEPGEPGERTVAVAPGSVEQGGSVTVSGTGWSPGTVELGLCDADGAACAPGDLTGVTAAVSAAGRLSGSATIAASAAPGARTLLVTQGTVRRSAALTVTADVRPPAGCETGSGAAATACDQQKINLVVNGGPLTMSRQPGEVTLAPVTLDGTEQTSTGALKQVEIVDARGGTVGWSLTGTLTDFTAAGGTKIPATALTWKPSCTAVGTASPVTAGSEGALGTGTAATLCSGAGGTGGIVGGTYDAGAGLLLRVPPATGAGEYTAVLTLTLS